MKARQIFFSAVILIYDHIYTTVKIAMFSARKQEVCLLGLMCKTSHILRSVTYLSTVAEFYSTDYNCP